MMSASYIVAAKRTAVVPRNGVFAHLDFHDLSAPVIRAILADAGLDAGEVGEIIVSNGLGAGGNPARLVALESDLPDRIGGLSIDRQCCGGLDALSLADAMIKSGQHDVVIAGGAESYSRRPLRSRTFADGSAPEPYEQARFTPWPDRDPDMAEAANALANMLHINKNQQDQWAIESHNRALAGRSDLEREIIPLNDVRTDPFTRALSQRLCDRAHAISGSITSANMCVAADGAAFCLVVSEKIFNRLRCPALELAGAATIGGDAALPGLAPIEAIKKVLKQSKLDVSDLAAAEIMEAFAVQAIACQQGTDIPKKIVNQHGGALARGHPIGASGAILAVRLFHDLTSIGGYGLATIAAAGGLGTALIAKAV